MRNCITIQMFRFGFGRQEEDADACSLATMYDRFADKDYSLRELILSMTQTDAFQYAQPVTP